MKRAILFFICCLFAQASFAATGPANPDQLVQDYLQYLGQHQTLRAAGQASATMSRGLTPVLAYAKANWHRLSPATQQSVSPWFFRPTTPGATPPKGVSFYAPGQVISTYATPHFVFHYLDQTQYPADVNRASPSFVQAMAAEAEAVWNKEVTSMGYAAPPSDINAPDNGGDALYDIYLLDLGNAGLYGYVTTDAAGPVGAPYANSFYSHMVIDNDFSTTQYGYPDPALPRQVTLAHEFFHSIHFGYDPTELPAFMEMSATWMEDMVYPTIKDNLQYIGEVYTDSNGNGRYDAGEAFTDRNGNGFRDSGSQDFPELALDSFNAMPGEQYGRFLWIRYLSDSFGIAIVKDIWTQAALTAGENTFAAMAGALQVAGSNLSDAFIEYGAWCFDVSRFQNGADYPMAWGDQVFTGVISADSYSSPSLVNLSNLGYSPQLHLSTVYEIVMNPSGIYQFNSNGTSRIGVLYQTAANGAYTWKPLVVSSGYASWTAPAGIHKAVFVIANTSQATDGMTWSLSGGTTAGGGGSGGGGGGCLIGINHWSPGASAGLWIMLVTLTLLIWLHGTRGMPRP
ncbi:MAG: hypothetical protein D6790_11010 [Caldilineae bacterium]|nr:MAG: hypothetical protein D6790_11010 [Caldilineae bacterium]